MNKYFKIGEISKLYDIGVDSLRYYEEIGIIKPRRSESGYRLYSEQDIGYLNIIRDLRDLGFGMETIKAYIDNQNVDSTLDLLFKEIDAIDKRLTKLKELRENVTTRISNIDNAKKIKLDTIRLEYFDERNCYSINKGYSQDSEMNILIKELVNKDKENLCIVGNNLFGTVIELNEYMKKSEIVYSSVFVVCNNGDNKIPCGKYLSVSYRGEYSQSRYWLEKLIMYAKEKRLAIIGDALEILWIDSNTSSDTSEYITELQIPVHTLND